MGSWNGKSDKNLRISDHAVLQKVHMTRVKSRKIHHGKFVHVTCPV